MDPTCRLVLQTRMPYLLENLLVNPMLTACLQQTGTLNDNLLEEINAKIPTNEKIECLIQKLKRRGGKAFQHFLTALRKSDQVFIADDLAFHKKNEETKCEQKIQEILSQYPTLSRRLSTAQDIPELKKLFAVREDLVQAKKENMDLQDTIDDMRSEMSKLQRHLEHYKQEVDDKQQELDELNAKLDDFHQNNEIIKNHIQETGSIQIDHMTPRNVQMATEYLQEYYSKSPTTKMTLQDIDEVDTQRKSRDNFTEMITDLQRKLKDKDDELHNIKKEHQTLLDDLNKQFGHLNNEVTHKTTEANGSILASGTSAIKGLLEGIAQTILPRQDSPVPDNPLQDHLNRAQTKISTLQKKVESLQQAKQKLRTRLNKAKKSLGVTQADVKRLESQITAEQEHTKMLQSILANSRRRGSTASNSTVSSCSSDDNVVPQNRKKLSVDNPPVLPVIRQLQQRAGDAPGISLKVPVSRSPQPLKLQTITLPS